MGRVPNATSPLPTTDDAPSTGLTLAIAAMRRDLAVYAFDSSATDGAEPNRSLELAGALAGLEETYAQSVGGGSRPFSGAVAAAVAADESAGGHIQRVCRYAMLLTGLVAPEHANDPQFEYGFLLHDIGKLTVPESILANPGALSDDEWELMKRHPEAGRALLDGIPFLTEACRIIVAHHERWNGQGYPHGLAGDEIPVGARILALCDAFNAITQDRPYRKASSIADARGEIHRGGKGQFWPEAVSAFLDLSAAELEAVQQPLPPGTDTVGSSASPAGALSTRSSGSPTESSVSRSESRLARVFARRRVALLAPLPH
jgi:HD-GYP domain-containing protein (c-di-GMP phosphodiesterase class II)